MSDTQAVYSSKAETAANGGVEHYPLNFDKLAKGMRIPVEEVEHIVGIKHTHSQFPLKLLALREHVERGMLVRGKVWTYCIRKNELIICDDKEAASYNERQTNKQFRCAKRTHYRNMAVDVCLLSDEERARHERTLLVNGRILQAVKDERRKIKVDEAKRITPALIEAKRNTPALIEAKRNTPALIEAQAE